jgi:hypothetical protein
MVAVSSAHEAAHAEVVKSMKRRKKERHFFGEARIVRS